MSKSKLGRPFEAGKGIPRSEANIESLQQAEVHEGKPQPSYLCRPGLSKRDKEQDGPRPGCVPVQEIQGSQ